MSLDASLASSTLVRGSDQGKSPGQGNSSEGASPPPPARNRLRRTGPGFGIRPLRGILPDLAVTTFLMVLYLRTLLPSIGYHMDTSKFGYLGQVLGTGHPPGEPLYLILNAAWVQLLPFGNAAWRANLLSAVFAVLACLVLMRAMRELGVGRWLSAAGAATIGVSRLFWEQSIVAEVYSLNALFVATVLYLLLIWLRTRRESILLAAAGVFALSFSNHPTGLMLMPGILVMLWRTGGYRVLIRPRNVLVLFGCGLITLSTYGYIVWRSLDPSTPYLELDIHNLGSFWSGITAEEFQSSMFGYGPGAFFTQQIPFALWHFWLQYFALAAAGVWGLAVLLRRKPQAGTLTLLWAFGVGIFAMGYMVSDSEVFYYVSWIILGIWIVVGLADLTKRVPRMLAGTARRVRWLGSVPLVIAVAAPFALAAANYTQVDLSDSDEHEKLAGVVRELPRKSIVFTPTYLGYQGLNYFLIPGAQGERKHQYAEMGAGRITEEADWTDLGGLKRYCRDGDPARLEWIRETVPPDLKTFVYTEDYADLVASYGYPVRQVNEDLYRMSCDRFGTIGS